jgi:Uncharacterized conserved protein
MTFIPAAAEILWAYHAAVPAARGPFDVIVCLGSYDESVARHAARLHLADPGSTLLFTGHKGNWTEGLYAGSEAEHFAGIAIAAGVPRERILIEPKATNIAENIACSEAMLPADPGRVVYLTKPQTQRRLLLTLKVASRLSTYHVGAPQRGLAEAIELFGANQIITEMVGDLDRVLKYPALGYMAADTVPGEVLAAFEDLKRSGFTGHLVSG